MVEAKKLETKNILINEENCKDLTIYFSRYVHSKSIKILSLHYGKHWRAWRKKYLLVNHDMLNKILDKTKETIGIVNFDNTKILIDTDNKLPDYTTLK